MGTFRLRPALAIAAALVSSCGLGALTAATPAAAASTPLTVQIGLPGFVAVPSAIQPTTCSSSDTSVVALCTVTSSAAFRLRVVCIAPGSATVTATTRFTQDIDCVPRTIEKPINVPSDTNFGGAGPTPLRAKLKGCSFSSPVVACVPEVASTFGSEWVFCWEPGSAPITIDYTSAVHATVTVECGSPIVKTVSVNPRRRFPVLKLPALPTSTVKGAGCAATGPSSCTFDDGRTVWVECAVAGPTTISAGIVKPVKMGPLVFTVNCV